MIKTILSNPSAVELLKKANMLDAISPSDLTPENEQILNAFVQNEYLKAINENLVSIKGWVTFFGILTILGLIGGLITLIVMLA